MKHLLFIIVMLGCTAASLAQPTPDKASTPIVTKVDGAALKIAIAPKGRPVLVNFWATFCDPCRDEFPDLVKIAADYKGRIDVITVSLDDAELIDTEVPKFLASMGAEMPAYLLSTPDEDKLIESISKEWGGGLPFTAIYESNGKMSYQKLGKFRPNVVRETLDRILGDSQPKP